MVKPETHAPQPKLVYVDNVKVLMTVLVIVHHTAITYGAPGNWYYSERTTHSLALMALTMLVSVNQSFFMGFFFLLSAYFTPAAYQKRGAWRFLGDRMIRLGVPLIFYSFIFSPILSFLVYYFAGGNHITYPQYLGGFDGWLDFGVLWYLAALVLLTLSYVTYRLLLGQMELRTIVPAPGAGEMLLTGFVLGLLTFFARIVFPVGWVLKPLGFQLGHFMQYIVYSVIGVVAFHNRWFEKLSCAAGGRMKLWAISTLFLFPPVYLSWMLTGAPIGFYSGGFHWQSLIYSVWEQIAGISILVALLVMARERWNRSSALLSQMARSCFAMYIFHPVVLIGLSLFFRDLKFDPFLKFLVVAPLAVVGTFLLSVVILMLPGIRRIL